MNKSILCTPKAFKVPTCKMDPRLIALMMPFDAEFDRVCKAVKSVAKSLSLNCKRADDIWDNPDIMQDVFDLIFKSHIIICDFSNRNANVLYEAGIANTLGREVILITQRLEDIPFDLKHYRCIPYLPNAQGLRELKRSLTNRLKTLMGEVDDYISVPVQRADEIIITKRWRNPKTTDGTVAPMYAESTETNHPPPNHPITTP